MYSVFTKRGDSEFLFVASREELEQAMQLAKSIDASWPHEYVGLDSLGNDVRFKEIPAKGSERSGTSSIM
jgi:hypothetical protein